MKAIEISEKQKEKLLEMCKKLFPEYFKDVIYAGSNNYPDYPASMSCRPRFEIKVSRLIQIPYLEQGDKEPLEYNVQYNNIYWFEFILCKLAPKLKKYGINTPYWELTLNKKHCQYKGHPIDYLYEQFKKLTNEQI